MRRRSWKMVSLGAVASLALSACSIPVALSAAQDTYGGGQFLQVHFKATLTSANPAQAKLATVLRNLTFDLNEQSLVAKPIKNSLNRTNQELVVHHGTARVATLLEHKSNLYLNINFSALSHVPGMTSSAGTLSGINLLLGDRWIEVPFSLVAKYAHSSTGLTLTRSSLPSGENLLVNAVVSLLAGGTATPSAHGFIETGSLTPLVGALSAGLKSAGSTVLPSTTLKGTYTLSVTMSGSHATGANVKVATPMAKYGKSVVRVFATFAHQSVAVATPTYPLVITPTLLKQIGSNGGGILSGSLG